MKTNLLHALKISTLLIFSYAFPCLSFAQWSAPVDISPSAISATINESMGSCLGVGGDTISVVYADKKNSKKSVLYYTQSIDTGLNWSIPVPITSPGGNAWNPAIAVNGRNVHIVWREIDTVTGKRASWYIHSLDGGNTWGSKVYLDSTADWPAVTVSGANIYMANDVITSNSPYNTEIFFMRSLDNGATWSARKQLTFAVGRSEDEAIMAQGSHIHMSWNDNRSGQFQILYKRSSDYGVTWDSDVVVDPQYDYNTMVSIDGAHADVIATGAPSGRYQVILAQSADTGANWTSNQDLSNDSAHTYFLPHMARDGSQLHVIANSSGGPKYFHSGDGGVTWDVPASISGSAFITYSGCSLHIIYINSSHVYYIRNPHGNSGDHCSNITSINNIENVNEVKIFPNPFSSQTTIEFSSNAKMENLKLGIFDVLGQEVMTTSFGNDNKVILNREELTTGIYFYRVFQNGKLLTCGKLAVE